MYRILCARAVYGACARAYVCTCLSVHARTVKIRCIGAGTCVDKFIYFRIWIRTCIHLLCVGQDGFPHVRCSNGAHTLGHEYSRRDRKLYFERCLKQYTGDRNARDRETSGDREREREKRSLHRKQERERGITGEATKEILFNEREMRGLTQIRAARKTSVWNVVQNN